jgi:DNA-binding MarR family transcriptional regulator
MSKRPDDPERAALMEVANHCLCRKARTAARLLTRFYEPYYAGCGIESTQFSLLVAIRLAGPVPMARLASLLGLERTTLTRNLDVLGRQNLVAMSVGTDARNHLVELTDAGREAVQRTLPRWQAAQKAAADLLGKADFSALQDALLLATTFNATSNPESGASHER